MFPFAYIYMKGRTLPLYNAAIEEVKKVILAKHPDAFRHVNLTISDFETAIQSSMAAAFPGTRQRGYWFHFGQVSACFQFISDFISKPNYFFSIRLYTEKLPHCFWHLLIGKKGLFTILLSSLSPLHFYHLI